jgi:hypothetical protein
MPTDDLDEFIDAVAAALALPLDPAWVPMIKANLETTLKMAQIVEEFPLSDEAEPACVFRA